MQPRGVLETSLYAADLNAAERFYGTVLGLPVIARESGRHVFFRCGRGMLLVFDPDTTGATDPESDIPPHGAHGPGHVALEMSEADVSDWKSRLAEHQIAIETETRWSNGGYSLYFRDPAGNSVELATARLWDITD